MANIKSQEKRIRTNERRRLRNQSVKSSLRTAIRGFREAVEAGEKDKATELLVSTSRQLDKAASKGSSTPTRPRTKVRVGTGAQQALIWTLYPRRVAPPGAPPPSRA